MKTWNEFQKDCAEAWRTQGMNTYSAAKEAYNLLLRCYKDGCNNLNQVAASAYELYKYGCNFLITEAHSGNDNREIEKAKAHFLAELKSGAIYGQYLDVVEIRFSDINYKIIARFYSDICPGEICGSVQVN